MKALALIVYTTRGIHNIMQCHAAQDTIHANPEALALRLAFWKTSVVSPAFLYNKSRTTPSRAAMYPAKNVMLPRKQVQVPVQQYVPRMHPILYHPKRNIFVKQKYYKTYKPTPYFSARLDKFYSHAELYQRLRTMQNMDTLETKELQQPIGVAEGTISVELTFQVHDLCMHHINVSIKKGTVNVLSYNRKTIEMSPSTNGHLPFNCGSRQCPWTFHRESFKSDSIMKHQLGSI